MIQTRKAGPLPRRKGPAKELTFTGQRYRKAFHEFNKRRKVENDRQAAQQRKWYAERKRAREYRRSPTLCPSCGARFKGKRADAKFCSPAFFFLRRREVRRIFVVNDAGGNPKGDCNLCEFYQVAFAPDLNDRCALTVQINTQALRIDREREFFRITFDDSSRCAKKSSLRSGSSSLTSLSRRRLSARRSERRTCRAPIRSEYRTTRFAHLAARTRGRLPRQ